MAKIKCKYCGKRIDEGLKKCPKCHKKLFNNKKKIITGLMYGLWFLIQSSLCFLLFYFGKKSLYSGYNSDLIIIGFIGGFIIINAIVMAGALHKGRKTKKVKMVVGIFTVLFTLFAFIYAIKIGKALIYDNSRELLILAEKYELSVAKDIKNEIESFFEYDSDKVFSRDIVISNFYDDEGISRLYIDDSYGNYRLKFFVYMSDFKIKDVYWGFDDHKLYLVKDGSKTDDFEFYYAMSIVEAVFGEDIKGLAKLEDDIEEHLKDKFNVSQNIMFNYEELDYHYSDNSFTIDGNLYNVNFYGDMLDEKFKVKFGRRDNKKDKHVWYYGDASFDYVNWNVNE